MPANATLGKKADRAETTFCLNDSSASRAATTSGLDYDLYLTSSAGTKLAASENAGTTEHVSYRNTNASAAKTIIINVHRYAGCSATPYSLSFTR